MVLFFLCSKTHGHSNYVLHGGNVIFPETGKPEVSVPRPLDNKRNQSPREPKGLGPGHLASLWLLTQGPACVATTSLTSNNISSAKSDFLGYLSYSKLCELGSELNTYAYAHVSPEPSPLVVRVLGEIGVGYPRAGTAGANLAWVRKKNIKDQDFQLVLSFHHVGYKDKTQGIGLGSKWAYPLSPLACPGVRLFVTESTGQQRIRERRETKDTCPHLQTGLVTFRER